MGLVMATDVGSGDALRDRRADAGPDISAGPWCCPYPASASSGLIPCGYGGYGALVPWF